MPAVSLSPLSASISHLPDWKRTALGSAIELWSSKPLALLKEQSPILLMGGIHGDEPEGVRLAQDTLIWLRQVTKTSPSHVVPWVVVPCLNVDGSARGNRVNGRGVDLNRNYPSLDWSPETVKERAKDRYNPGPSAGSEPEIQAVVELIEQIHPRLIIHCHSWKPCIVGAGDTSKVDATRLSRSSGYELMDDIGYRTPGSLSSYGWSDRQIPVICIEEQDNLTDLGVIWPRFAVAMQEIFSDLSTRAAPPQKPSI